MFAFFTSSYALALPLIKNNNVVCNVQECESVVPLFEDKEEIDFNANTVYLYQTSPKNNQFLDKETATFSTKHNSGWQHIEVDRTKFKEANGKPFHSIIGFGGSFSDTASLLYKSVSPTLQKHLIDAYFSKNGLEYSLGRVTIASADFSCRDSENNPALKNCDKTKSQYSYDDSKNDFILKNFALQKEDNDYKIPFIQAALSHVPNLKLFASPWSAPAWMKNNLSMVHGNLINTPSVKQAWANYFVRFLSEYQNQGVNFWGITVQNEPALNGVKQWWQTMYSSEDEQAEFIQNYLGPIVKEYNPNLSIIIHDDQLSSIEKRSLEIINHPTYTNAKNYIDGIGLHWYENELVPNAKYSNITKTHSRLNKLHQNQFILGTEACMGYMPCSVLSGCGPILGSVYRAEAYAHDIMQDLNHNVAGWADWNLLLDMQGGPNWAGNNVDAPILVDYETDTFYKQPMYYYLGHFSKFIKPASQMLNAQSKGPFPLEQVSFLVPANAENPEYVTVVVLNRDVSKRKFYIHDVTSNKYINATIEPKSIQTFIYF